MRFEANVHYGNRVSPLEDARAVRRDPLMLHPGSDGAGLSTLEGYQLREGSSCLLSGVLMLDAPRQDFGDTPVPPGAALNIKADQR